MEEPKIGRRIVALALVGTSVAVMIGSFFGFEDGREVQTTDTTAVVEKETNTESDSGKSDVIETVETESATGTNKETTKETEMESETVKKVGEVEIYTAVDFEEIVVEKSEYELLLEKRAGYVDVMLKIINNPVKKYSKEECAAAIYNVIRLDNDLCELLNKLVNKELDSNNDVATRAQNLNKFSKDIANLSTLISQTTAEWSAKKTLLYRSDVEKITRVTNYNTGILDALSSGISFELEAIETVQPSA